MSSQKYASPLRIELRPSRILFSTVLCLHAGAFILPLMLAMPGVLKTALLFLVGVSACLCSRQLGWGAQCNGLARLTGGKWPRLRQALWDHDDLWRLTDEFGCVHQARLLPTTLVHRHLVVLNLRLPDQPWYCRHRSVVLLYDNIDSETFRRLRVRLRWYAPPEPGSSAVLK